MPKTKQPSKLHRALRLQHHRHTGKLLHHQHTSFRGLAIILFITGICIVGLGMLNRATADDLAVYASIPAPIPPDPAVITNPTEGETVSNPTVIVEGTCPDITPHVLVAILDNGEQVASVACDNTNHFSVPIVVSPGSHTLVARVYTITGDAGQDSVPVHFAYIVPTVPTQPTNTPTVNTEEEGEPLQVIADKPFIVFGPAKDAVWSGTITGGTLPYQVYIDWGDGSSNDYLISVSGKQQFNHHYTSMQSHLILLRVTDANGHSITRHYAAVTPYIPPVLSTLLPKNPSLPFQGSIPLGIYGLYVLLLAIFGFVWTFLHPAFAFAPVYVSHSGVHGSHFLLVAAKKRRKKDKKQL
jgi:hypothetical protein